MAFVLGTDGDLRLPPPSMHTCKAFVCVLTKRYVRSVYCNGELYEAVALKKCMFPVVYMHACVRRVGEMCLEVLL